MDSSCKLRVAGCELKTASCELSEVRIKGLRLIQLDMKSKPCHIASLNRKRMMMSTTQRQTK